MRVTLHMCGPQGEALRQQLSNVLNTLKMDNRYVINAMLNSGSDVPDTVIDAGLDYVPSRHRKTRDGDPVLDFYGMRRMFASGTFSCADAAAYEAAVLEEKYGIPTEVLCVGEIDMHAIYVTVDGVVDPTLNWMRKRKKPLPRKRFVDAKPLGAKCYVVNGRVACDTL